MCHYNFVNFNLFIILLVFYNVFCDRIVFPDEFEGNDHKNLKDIEGFEKAKSIKISSQEDDVSMPLEMIQKLNSISNVSELFHEFVITDMNLEPTNFGKGGLYGMASKLRASSYMSDRNGEREEGEGALDVLTRSGANIGRSATRRVPKAAGCIPALSVVSLYNSENRRIFAYPSCTRIERCGGCCQHELLSCQPNNTEIVNYEVFIMEYVGGEKIAMVGREMVSVEKHTECKCGCIVKQKDCTKLQEYRERECRCVCTNNDEETKCLAEIESDNKLNKLWDPHNCVCQCRNILECSSGHFFSEATCQCEAIAALSVRGGIGGTSKQESDQHDYNVYKILPSYRERQRYRNPI